MGLIAEAWAQGAAPGQGSMIGTLVLPLLMVAVLYLVLIRPQQKRAKEQRMMVEALKTGDEVVTSGGILGRITDVAEQFVTVEIADGVQIKVQKYMISALMPKGTVKNK
jgi:preprotein translocase subunit YajC